MCIWDTQGRDGVFIYHFQGVRNFPFKNQKQAIKCKRKRMGGERRRGRRQGHARGTYSKEMKKEAERAYAAEKVSE